MSCKICGGSVRRLFSVRDYRRPVDRTEYLLNWCDSCEFGRLEGDFTPDVVQPFYDVAYYTHESIETASNKLTFWGRLRNHLAWRADYGSNFTPMELGEPAQRSVCDIGCGSGDNLVALKNAGFDVVGIEPDAKARSRSGGIARVFDGTAEELPSQIKTREFDVVFMSHVLEHCVDLHATLANICSILKRDGKIVIEVPNNGAKGFSTFAGMWPWSDIPRHINFFTEKSLRLLLHGFDLEISSVHYAGYYRQFSPEWIKTQNEIWAVVGTGSRPKFGLAAWLLLSQTAVARRSRKYDSIRVHALPRPH